MNPLTAPLFEYFGPLGVLSVLGWSFGLFVVLRYFLDAHRRLLALLAVVFLELAFVGLGWQGTLLTLPAIALALRLPEGALVRKPLAFFAGTAAAMLIGYYGAQWTSGYVSAIQEDQTEELARLERQRQMMQKAAMKAQEEKAAPVKFAEDTAKDRLDLAGVKSGEKLNVYEKALEEEKEARYAYQKDTRKAREKGKGGQTRGDEAEVKKEAGAPPAGRIMKREAKDEADALDRVNLFAARVTALAVLAALLYVYLRRFNETRTPLWPLPLACRWLDRISPKQHLVAGNAASPDEVRAWLERMVRKGETFICCAPASPWTQPRLARVQLGPLSVLPLVNVTCGGESAAPEAAASPNAAAAPAPGQVWLKTGEWTPRFVFSSAWFGRHSFVVVDRRQAEQMLAELVPFLRQRRVPRASARRSVNVVWNFADLPSRKLLEELLPLCKAVNWRFILATPKAREVEDALPIEEWLDQPAPAATST